MLFVCRVTYMAEFDIVKAEKSNEEAEYCWSDLSLDLIGMIFPRLSDNDGVAFSCVCKSWRWYGVKFRRLPPPPYLGPYIFSTQRSNLRCKFYCPKDNTYYHTYKNNISQVSNSYVRHSNFGWLLMSTYTGDLFFFNPFTKAKIDLPKLPQQHSFSTFYFSSAPTSRDCLVVGLMCQGSVGVIRINTKQEWEIKGLKTSNPEVVCYDDSYSSPVFYKGKYYSLGQKGYVLTLNLNSKDWSFSVSTKLSKLLSKNRCELHHDESYLLEAEGELHGVFVYGEQRHVCVYKLKTSGKYCWEAVEDLGDTIFYVSSANSFAEKSATGNNRIYFPNFDGENGLYYCLKTKKYRFIAGDTEASCNLQQNHLYAWIKHPWAA